MNLAPHAFSLRQLQYAIAVADALSFRRAAERCHVSQPALSSQLAQLEQTLGVRMFERDRRRVLVTPAGREIIERARRLLIEADDLVDASRRAGDPLAGTLRIGVIPTLSPYLLPAVAPALRKAFPRLRLAWREDKTALLVALLAAGELDAALVALEAEIGDVEREVIARDLKLSELRGEEVLLLDDGHCFREQALEVCTSARAREGEFRATSLPTLIQMVAAGVGITLLPAVSVAAETQRADLALRELATPNATRTIALVWRRHAPIAPVLRDLSEVLRESYPGRRAASGTRRRRASRRAGAGAGRRRA